MANIKYKTIETKDLFKCSANECPQTCCSNWKIHIDKDTYNKYFEIKDNEVFNTNQLESCLLKNDSNTNFDEYAYMKLNSEGNCPYFNKERLCDIHKLLSENYLGFTCLTYPRKYKFVNNVLEKTLTLSCPEASKLILSNKQKLKVCEISEEINNEVFIKNIEFIKNKNIVVDKNIRNYCLELIQNRYFNIENRLKLIAVFLDNINQTTDINCYINNFSNNLDEEILKFSTIIKRNKFMIKDVDFNVDYSLMNELLKLNLNDEESYYKEIYNKIELGLKLYDYKNTYESLIYYNRIQKDFDYIIENYLFVYLFEEVFPNSQFSYEKAFYKILVVFAVLKMHLVGLSLYYKGDINENNIIELIYVLSKKYNHNKKIYSKVCENYISQIQQKNLMDDVREAKISGKLCIKAIFESFKILKEEINSDNIEYDYLIKFLYEFLM